MKSSYCVFVAFLVCTAAADAGDTSSRLRARISHEVSGGKQPMVLVNVMGRTRRGKLIAAGDAGITVRTSEGKANLLWEKITPRQLLHIACKVLGRSREDLTLLAEYSLASNLTNEAARLDKSLARRIEELQGETAGEDPPKPGLREAASGPAKQKPRGGARIIGMKDGDDWWLPPWVKLTPYSGWLNWGYAWQQKKSQDKFYHDGNMHFASWYMISWADIEPEEGKYDWNRIDRWISTVTSKYQGLGFVFWIMNYSTKFTFRGSKVRNLLPQWLVDNYNVKSLSNGAVAAWDPASDYQKYFGRMVKALGRRYRDHPKFIACDMRGLDCHHGEWCWRDGRPLVEEAERDTHLTAENFRRWAFKFVDDFLEGFKGHEHQLVWQNGGSTFIWDWDMGRKYHKVSQEIWAYAYSKGCGGRDGMVEDWNGYMNPGHGFDVNSDGYLEEVPGFGPFVNGSMWYTENEFYYRPDSRFGPLKYDELRWFTSCMRTLQMRRNWLCPHSRMVDEHLPEFNRWMEFEFGKTAETSPDAWCWLREGYPSYVLGKPQKNWERWLIQRDGVPGGRTVRAAEIDTSILGQRYNKGGKEYHARRTNLAGGNAAMYFRADRKFASGKTRMLLKVTYLDGPATQWCVEYIGRKGAARSQPVTTKDSGTWKTVTFEMRDVQFVGAFEKGMDFRLACLGPNDLTVKFVRLIKRLPPRK